MNDMIKILLIEDDPLLQEVYKLIFEREGFEVVTASDGIQALEALNSYNPNLILLDFFMPHMDGAEFLRRFERSAHPDIRIIVTSNISDQKRLDDMITLGADSHILKASLSPSELVAVIRHALEP